MNSTDTATAVATRRNPSPREFLRRILVERANKGLALPSELALAREVGVSRPALRELIAEFAADGLLSRRRGAVTQINHQALQLKTRFDHAVDLGELFTDLGYQTSTELLSVELAEVAPEESDDLQLATGTRVLKTLKRWRADGTVAAAVADYIALPNDITTIPAAPERGVFELIEELHGGRLEWSIFYPTADIADANLAAILEIDPQTPVLACREHGSMRSGDHIWSACEWHPPGFIQFSLVRNLQ